MGEDHDGSSQEAPAEIPIWWCLWATVEVFEHCELDVVAGGFGVQYKGISAREVHAACTLLRIPRHDWPDMVQDVQCMGRAVARAFNARINRE